MRILISGGAGFIGSHIADYLIQQGYSITILDNFSTGKEENINHLILTIFDNFIKIKLLLSENAIIIGLIKMKF